MIESILTNENKRHEVRVTRSFQSFEGEAEPVSNAVVTISDGEETFSLTPKEGAPGVYWTDPLVAVFGKNYTLMVTQDAVTYQAHATAAPGSPIEPLNLESLETGDYEFIYEESSQPSMLELSIAWEEPDDNDQIVTRNIDAFYFTLDVLEVNKIFAPDKEVVVFPRGASVFRRKYSLSEAHQEFLRSFLSEVDWRGGFFDVAQGNVVTNFDNGALGFFAVSMVQTDQQIVN